MDSVVAVVGILGALLVGAASPGPSFVLVARTSIASSRHDGLASAIGMGVGGAMFGTLALVGLRAVIFEMSWLYFALKIGGGVYLLYLAYRLWQGASATLEMRLSGQNSPRSLRLAFLLGLATQLSNPKTAVVYAGVFAALLPATPAAWVFVALPIGLFLIEAGWYAIVACAFSAPRPRAAYLRSKGLVDRLAGAVLGALGVRLVLDAATAD